jgi:hypothetical protein
MNDNALVFYPNVLLVAGTGRNSGKTTFVTTICSQFPEGSKPVCIKISNHFHEQAGSLCLIENSNFRIFEETQVSSQKDSARMLEAGAVRSFFIEADREFVYQAFKQLIEFIPDNVPIICESGNLRNYLIPAMFVMLHTNGTEPKPAAIDLFPLADKVLVSEPGDLQIPVNFVTYNHKTWKINL